MTTHHQRREAPLYRVFVAQLAPLHLAKPGQAWAIEQMTPSPSRQPAFDLARVET